MCFFSSFLFLSCLMCIWVFPKMVGTPHFTPQVMIIFKPGKPMGQLGKPTMLGNNHMDVSKNRGTPIRMDDLGVPLF